MNTKSIARILDPLTVLLATAASLPGQAQPDFTGNIEKRRWIYRPRGQINDLNLSVLFCDKDPAGVAGRSTYVQRECKSGRDAHRFKVRLAAGDRQGKSQNRQHSGLDEESNRTRNGSHAVGFSVFLPHVHCFFRLWAARAKWVACRGRLAAGGCKGLRHFTEEVFWTQAKTRPACKHSLILNR